MSRSVNQFTKAVVWFMLCILVGCVTNALLKYLGATLNPWKITFYRCFFSTVVLLPIIYGRSASRVSVRSLGLHVVRGLVFALAMSLWSYSLPKVPIALAILINFTTPLFVLVLAPLMLNEQVTWHVWSATTLAFLGIGAVLQPVQDFSLVSLLLVLASALFGLLDVLNKKQLYRSSISAMLFYASFFATLFLTPAIFMPGPSPSYYEFGGLVLLGLGSNLLLYCLLRAFALSSASSLAPFRYLELPVAAMIGYFFFREVPDSSIYLGAVVVIPCTLFALYHQQYT